MIRKFFVYGTLKTGQCRSQLWPHKPTEVFPAWTYATLYGRSDYPAMRPGTDRVLGEVWQFSQRHVQRVLGVIDAVEVTNQPGQPDLYHRELVDTWTIDGQTLGQAYTYFYASDPLPDGFARLKPPEDQTFVSWQQASA